MLKQETEKIVGGITRKIFCVFVCASLLALVYFNMTTRAELWLVSEQFPEIGEDWKMTIIRSYKVAVSAVLFFVDVILVGPFAYLGYFSEHIKPRRGNFFNRFGFFDFGLLLALWFTLTFVAVHWFVLNAVTPHSKHFISVDTGAIISVCALLLWAVGLLFKIYSYSRSQRSELKKYAIRF